jgi:hypothetical protein
MAELQGGRFGNGFITAGAGAVLAPIPEAASSNPGMQTVMAAVVGGTISELSGGKFANGAVTGAFQFAVGRAISGSGQDDGMSVTGCGSRYGCGNNTIWGSAISDFIDPRVDPGLAALATSTLDQLPLGSDGEWTVGVQFRGPVGYVTTNPVYTKYEEVGNALVVRVPRQPNDLVAFLHTHPRKGIYANDMANLDFGPGDADLVYKRGIPNFLKNSSSGIRVLRPTPIGPISSIIRSERQIDLPSRIRR